MPGVHFTRGEMKKSLNQGSTLENNFFGPECRKSTVLVVRTNIFVLFSTKTVPV